MAVYQYNNIFNLENSAGTNLATSPSTTFYVFASGQIVLEKAVDRGDQVYYSGNSITFTLTITNYGGAIPNAKIKDTIDSIVNVTGYSISGQATQSTGNNVDIVTTIPSAGANPSTTTIQIFGTIK